MDINDDEEGTREDQGQRLNCTISISANRSSKLFIQFENFH